MAPSVERFTARLLAAAFSPEEILEIAARGCHESAAIRRDVDAELAVRTPVPERAVNDVLLSPDLAPRIFASLEVKDHTAALACKAWGAAWKARSWFRVLRPAPCPASDSDLPYPYPYSYPMALAALPGGERMAIALHCEQSTFYPQQVFIVDKEMKLQRSLGDNTSGITFDHVQGIAAGHDGLYVAEDRLSISQGRLRRFELDTFAVAAELTGGEYSEFYQLALAPGGVLFVLATTADYTTELLALDALSLEVRFTLGEDVWGGGSLRGLAVGGDEVYVGKTRSRSIHVLSLSGEPLRVISRQPGGWRQPHALCCVADRLYLIEGFEAEQPMNLPAVDDGDKVKWRLAGRRVFVLTPEGRTLWRYTSSTPLEDFVQWAGMCHFDGKLMVAGDGNGPLALQGL